MKKVNKYIKKVLITGTSSGIGKAAALLFLSKNIHEDTFEVIGIDKNDSTIDYPFYTHYQVDLRNKESLPDIEDIDILINNAGSQNSEDDIENNLKSTIYVTEKYAFQKSIKSVLFNASASAHTGFEFPYYSASKAGILGYMKNVAWRLAKQYKATCNSISCGGVFTPLNDDVVCDEKYWKEIMKATPLKKWATAEEIAEWIYFLTVINKSCTGQDILIDNGEKDLNCTFVWPGIK